jgi:hypothetical protein
VMHSGWLLPPLLLRQAATAGSSRPQQDSVTYLQAQQGIQTRLKPQIPFIILGYCSIFTKAGLSCFCLAARPGVRPATASHVCMRTSIPGMTLIVHRTR